MPITHLPLAQLLASNDHTHRRSLTEVNVRIAKARKVVVVSGAGISCSSGIPDFRSTDGLYNLVKERYPDSFVTGKELFSSALFANPETTSIFYTFIAELRRACDAAEPTRTHHFIRRLASKGKLLRSYTQNVDGLERRIGLESGGRGRGLKKNGTRNVELHGDLGRVRCVLCCTDYEAIEEWVEMFREGNAPSCPACEERCESRINRSARATSIGTLRPSIVLYDEHHPLGDDIGVLQDYDVRRGPDVLLIMGTSLKVHGLKHLIKDFARAVHEKKGGAVVFVNTTAPSKEWEGVIDYHVEGETDRWVERVEEEWKRVRPQDWERQTLLDGEVVLNSVAKAPAKSKKGKLVVEIQSHSHLPTPPASQQTMSDDMSSPLSSPPPSSPFSPPSRYSTRRNTPSPSRRTPVVAPPTPVSPSKRGCTSSAPSKVVTKKSRLRSPPPTGQHATPGGGNLFGDSDKPNIMSSQTSSDEELFGAIKQSRRGSRGKASALPTKPPTKAPTGVSRMTRSQSVAPETATATRRRSGVGLSADKPHLPGALASRATRRTASLRL